MADTKKKKRDSAEKRVITAEVRNLRNRMFKSAFKTLIKKYELTVASGDKAAASTLYTTVIKKVDKAAAKGIIHSNNAAHKKSRFTKMLNAM